MIVILLGAPGSGKGTQSMRLASKFGFTHLATGDILRAEVAQGTDLGKKADGYMKGGKLVPDAIVIEMVAGKIASGGNFLLDGFPRTIDQAQGLDQILKLSHSVVSLVVYLTLPLFSSFRSSDAPAPDSQPRGNAAVQRLLQAPPGAQAD